MRPSVLAMSEASLQPPTFGPSDAPPRLLGLLGALQAPAGKLTGRVERSAIASFGPRVAPSSPVLPDRGFSAFTLCSFQARQFFYQKKKKKCTYLMQTLSRKDFFKKCCFRVTAKLRRKHRLLVFPSPTHVPPLPVFNALTRAGQSLPSMGLDDTGSSPGVHGSSQLVLGVVHSVDSNKRP